MAFDGIAWQAPWFAPFSEPGAALAQSADWVADANRLAVGRQLLNHRGLPVHFIPQAELPEGASYEAHISAMGQVPTRDNPHDFFNALAWLHFPRIKRALNALHAQAFEEPVRAGTRGRQRDAATLFDENAALFISTREDLLTALREHRWRQVLFRDACAFDADCQVMLFGHALLEKLVAPYKSLTAHVWTVLVDEDWWHKSDGERRADIDRRVSESISRGFTSADFCHLPVLGVPGWWPGQDAAFYDDAAVFRPRRQLKSPSASPP